MLLRTGDQYETTLTSSFQRLGVPKFIGESGMSLKRSHGYLWLKDT